MVESVSSLENLGNQLESIRNEWNGFSADYDGHEPDPSLDRESAEFAYDAALDMMLAPTADFRPFARAWAETLLPARQLLLAEFTCWAAAVVEAFGIERFPLDCGDPRPPDWRQLQSSQASLAHELTGSSDTSVAGMRLMLWAAAYRAPEKCRRDGYESLLFHWAKNLIDFGSGRCRTLGEPFDWVPQAFELLALQSVTDEAEPQNTPSKSRNVSQNDSGAFTPPQLAKEWKVSPDKIRGWIRSGELLATNMSTRPGGRPRYLIQAEEKKAFEMRRSAAQSGQSPESHRGRGKQKNASIIKFF